MNDPSRWMFPEGHKVYQKFLRVNSHLQSKGDTASSVKALQECLSKHRMRGSRSIPITGTYWTMTDEVVRLCQHLHIPPEDPEMQSMVSAEQWEHLAEDVGCPYVFVPETEQKPASDGDWFAPRSITKLLTEINLSWPDRDKTRDRVVIDAARSDSYNDHNPVGHPLGPKNGTIGSVHAIDITAKGIDVERVINSLKRDTRVSYVIHDGYIWSKNHEWKKLVYDGPDQHKTYIHMSLNSDTQALAVESEMNAKPWGILEGDRSSLLDPETLTRGDIEALRTELIGVIDEVFRILTSTIGR